MSSEVLDGAAGGASADHASGRPRHRRRGVERSSSTTVRRDLEGLRAVAVLGVVIYHLRASWLPGGFAGVDVFFVLSGFFITGLLLREGDRSGRVDLRAFWGRRARRLLPVSALVMLLTLGASLLVVDPLDTARYATHGLWVSVFGLNWILARDGTNYLADTDPSPFQHYWSLGVEEQFYVGLPLLVLVVVLLTRRRVAARRPALFAIVAAASVLSFVIALRQTVDNQPYAYFATYGRIWQLCLGAALAIGMPLLSRLTVPLRTLARLAGVVLIVSFYVLASLQIFYPGWYALWPTLGAGLIVAAGVARADARPVAARGDLLNRVLSSPPAQLIGRYSYGWYLWHWPPLVLLPIALNHRLTGRYLVLVALGTLALAVLSYHLLEHPVRSSSRLADRRGALSLVLGLVLVLVGVAGAATAKQRADYQLSHSDAVSATGGRLDPQPAEAGRVQPAPTNTDCELALTSDARNGTCRYEKDTGAGEVILVGDSHAVQYFPAVDSIARTHGWGLRVWTRVSCPLADIDKIDVAGSTKLCSTWRQDVLARIIAAKPRLLVVSSYASLSPAVYDRSTGQLMHGAAARAIYAAGQTRSLARIRAAGIRVLVIRDDPAYVESGPKCALRNPDELARCSAPQSTALQSAADKDGALAVPGVQVLDLTKVFCSNGRCYQVIGNILAYRDSNHLTVRMSQFLTPRVEAAAVRAFG